MQEANNIPIDGTKDRLAKEKRNAYSMLHTSFIHAHVQSHTLFTPLSRSIRSRKK